MVTTFMKEKRELEELSHTCVMTFGSIKSGNRKTANKESDVNALAGVKSPPRSENIAKETTVTITGILFSIKLFSCKCKDKDVKSNNRKTEYIKPNK